MHLRIIAPRLHIIFAENLASAVILRRGPTRHVATFGWNVASNEIKLGQWFYGRIYEHRSSLSPDGKYFLYAAMNCKWESETGGIWAAVSKAPYIKAIELYTEVPEMGGGGLFVSETEYVLNEIFFNPSRFLFKSSEVTCLSKEDEHCMYGVKGVYIERLLRLGWKYEKRIEHEKRHTTIVFSKILSEGKVLYKGLVSKYPAKKTEWEEHTIIYNEKVVFYTDEWECGDAINGNIYFTKSGQLKYIDLTSECGNLNEHLIHDFNNYKFQANEAPY